jgi:LysR family hydrogen peroxide-inducible transcriptional activator
LRQLQYVQAVAAHLSFGRAAEQCSVSQPALSMQVAQVEDALGLTLFERDRRGVQVTAMGAQFLTHVRALLAGADGLTQHARRLQNPLTSMLRVGVIPTIAPYLLPVLAPALRASFPELVVLWTEERTSTLVAQVKAQEIDAALLAAEADLGDLETAPVGIEHFCLALPPGHRLAASEHPVSLAAVNEEPMLLLEDGHCLRTQALAACAHAGLREQAFRGTSLSTLAQVVAAGVGLTLLPRLAADVERARAPLSIVQLEAPTPFRTLVLGWRADSPLAASLQRLAEVMRVAAGVALG